MKIPQLSSENFRTASPPAGMAVITAFPDFIVIEPDDQRRNARSAWKEGSVISQLVDSTSTHASSSECECTSGLTPVIVESWDVSGSSDGNKMMGKCLRDNCTEKQAAVCLTGGSWSVLGL